MTAESSDKQSTLETDQAEASEQDLEQTVGGALPREAPGPAPPSPVPIPYPTTG